MAADDETQDKPEGTEHDGAQERRGPGPSDAPTDDGEEQGPSGPPPDSIPGDSGEVPNPKQ